MARNSDNSIRLAVAAVRSRFTGTSRRRRSLAVFAFLPAAFLFAVAAPPARAQTSWAGTVEVSPDGASPISGSSVPLNFDNKNSATYWFRLAVEGSRPFALSDGTLTPTGEAGLRRDGRDTDKGIGLLVGGGVSYRAEGYIFRGSAHGILARAEIGFGEWGVSGSVRVDPDRLGRGFFLTVAPRWGAAPGGIDSLQPNRGTWGPAGAQGFQPDGRFEAEIGYGMRAPVGAGLLTPHAGLSLSLRGRQQWRAGARWHIAPQSTLGIEGTRDMTGGRAPAGHSFMLRADSRW